MIYHLRVKQAQPKKGHSPEVVDRVENYFVQFVDPNFRIFFYKPDLVMQSRGEPLSTTVNMVTALML